MYPILFQPDYKDRVWGGDKLKTVLNKDIPNQHTGESWEIAAHDNGDSIILNGRLKGLTLLDALKKEGESIIGRKFLESDKFPLLIKIIDAKDKLSVQVHPEDDYAKVHENGELGKSEAWYIIQADPGAKLIAGLKEGTNKEIFEEHLKNNTLEAVLNEVEVKAGDVLNIPAGLIHAICDGILLAEVQQNSDTTYRVYDWGRLGLDGKPRELHVKKSLDVIDFDFKHSTDLSAGETCQLDNCQLTTYIRCPYFIMEELKVSGEFSTNLDEASYHILINVKGQANIQYDGGIIKIKEGQTCMIPNGLKNYKITSEACTIIRTYEA